VLAKRMVRRIDRIKKDHEKAMAKLDADKKKLKAEEKENIRKIFGRIRTGENFKLDVIETAEIEFDGDDCEWGGGEEE